LLYGCITHTVNAKYRYTKPIPHSSNLGLFSLSTAWLSILESFSSRCLYKSLQLRSVTCSTRAPWRWRRYDPPKRRFL
jgi:hypothetical protein